MQSIRRPIAIAVGTFIGFVVLGGSSIESGLTGAVTAFIVMFILQFSLDR